MPSSAITKSAGKKISRISDFNQNTNSYSLAAYLIAQLGKNFNVPNESQISGKQILELAYEQIMLLKYNLGGIVEFVECDDVKSLLQFYTANGFIEFNQRNSKSNPQHILHQLLKII